MNFVLCALLLSYSYQVSAQKAGMTQDDHPTITLKECTLSGGCSESQAKLTLDANWRWIHRDQVNCYTDNLWDNSICNDPKACAKQCAVEGVSADKYRSTYGIEQIAGGVKVNFVTEHQYGTNVGSRLYVLDGDENKYKLFYLKNREFSFDVDVSNLECGINGAMYFSEMDGSGGYGKGDNQAGARYGTGYCDAQCPHDIKFIDGEANVLDWTPNPKDKSNNMGRGRYGSCCAEMDIWEANNMATAYTPHTCGINGQLMCEGIDCGDNDKNERYDGVCDKDGCDINPYRMGDKTFYGPGAGFVVDTNRPMTVVTQFLTDDDTDTGNLSEIRRFYVQDGKTIENPIETILDDAVYDSITDEFCDAKKDLFGDVKHFQQLGGMRAMGDSLDRGHVMIFSLWDDVEVNMLWLDSSYPTDEPKDEPGVKRGECPGGDESTPTYLRNKYPNAYVTFRNAAVGEIGSTQMPSSPTPNPEPTPNQPTPNQPTPNQPTPIQPTQPTTPTSPTPGGGDCGCGPAQGMNQAECNGKEEALCKRMIEFENKCSWTVCTDPPIPEATSEPTNKPTNKSTNKPTDKPTNKPTDKPTIKPSKSPIARPTNSGGSCRKEKKKTFVLTQNCGWLAKKNPKELAKSCKKKAISEACPITCAGSCS